jgi:hypothetical protein
MAGLNSGEPAKKPVTPEDLIRRFCDGRAAGLAADPGTTETDGVKVSRGWCGYIGGRGDSMVVGFDEGYDFLGYLTARGWKALHEKGDWPYVVYLYSRCSEKRTIIGYCEGDLTIRTFDNSDQAREFYDSLPPVP